MPRSTAVVISTVLLASDDLPKESTLLGPTAVPILAALDGLARTRAFPTGLSESAAIFARFP